MSLFITPLLKKNLKDALRIYNYYVVHSYSNFEEKKVSLNDFTDNYRNITNKKLPYLAAMIDENLVGIAYLNKFREKSGYRFSFENTIYVHNDYLKKGIGSKLLKQLITLSKKNKEIKKIVAVIGSIDSVGSIKVHKKLGFKNCGRLKKIGFKKGKWIDSIIMQKDL
tara:strand:- start:2848 stop:3348 length:501 start_codon:yes stop_codon:yes gene_type:complete